MKRIYSRLFVWKNFEEVLGYFMFSFIIHKLLRQSREYVCYVWPVFTWAIVSIAIKDALRLNTYATCSVFTCCSRRPMNFDITDM